MFKFFRKIRQRLLGEKRITKYLIYAFGEIILVVIGILIALQVNIWNEAKKSVKAQNELLLKLVGDLENDVALFNEIDSIYHLDLQNIKYVMDEALSLKNTQLHRPE